MENAITGVREALSDVISRQIAQCWGCSTFDTMFSVVSNAGAAVYEKLIGVCFLLFAVFFFFYVVWVVWKHLNIKTSAKETKDDPYYTKSVVKVVINALIALAILGMGVAIPRFVGRLTFEPVADITLVYSENLLSLSPETVETRVPYTPKEMSDDGMFRSQLRNTVVKIIQVTTTQFQMFFKLSLAVMDSAFAWNHIYGLGSLFRHGIIFFIGLFLFFGIGRLFVKFCFYFIDTIMSMAMFAFLFPFGLLMMAFRGIDMPEWMSSLGKGLGTSQIKKLVNSIVTLGAAVITYLVTMVLVTKFFADNDISGQELIEYVDSGAIFDVDFAEGDPATLTLVGTGVLLFVMNYICDQIPQVTKMILSTFGVSEEKTIGDDVAGDAQNLYEGAKNKITKYTSGNGENAKTDAAADASTKTAEGKK